MESAMCSVEGMCENFFHPRNQLLNDNLYQSHGDRMDETFDASPSLSSPSPSNRPATGVDAEKAIYDSPVHRLIKERLRWLDEQEIEKAEESAPEIAVTGLQQLFLLNCKRPQQEKPAAAPGSNQPTSLKVHERVVLESMWKKQMERSANKSTLLGGKLMPTTDLSVNQVRFGKA